MWGHILPPLIAQGHVEQNLVVLLAQLAFIIVVARVFAWAFRRVGQPTVVGEIAAGLFLGPSVLGAIPALHGTWSWFFQPHDPEVQHIFVMLSQLGLIFLLFLIGLEFDFRHLKANSRSAIMISAMGVVAPFALGYALAQSLFPYTAMPDRARLGFGLFMGTSMSITAIPILGRIMIEMKISRTRLGAITITAAAIDDATGWILLAAISAMVRSGFNLRRTEWMLGETAGFAVFMIFVARPLLRAWARAAVRRGGGAIGINDLAVVIAILFLCAIATSLIGIFAIFGAFLLGAVLSDETQFRQAVGERLRDFITAFFLPIFFTYTGLRTDVGSVGGPILWTFAAAVSVFAILGKFGGCALAARLTGWSGREAAIIGVMMNTRALMELIVINVGYDLNVVPRSVFCMLVLMALLTTVMTSPILLKLVPGTDLEPLVRESGFLRRK